MHMDTRHHFDGTAARQLDFDQFQPADHQPARRRESVTRTVPSLRLLQKDVYAELTRRRRRAQISARKWVE
jgi:phage-related baseplate assembly protein